MSTLHLTPEEQTLFHALPDALREGWSADAEVLTVADEPPRKLVRLKLLSLQDPTLRALQDRLSRMEDPAAAAAALAELDLSSVSQEDLAELVFAMGPSSLSTLIASLLKSASTDEDLEDLASLTFLRRELLSAANV